MTFADAVVAIAVTLLVLPLVELATDIPEGATLGSFLGDHAAEIGGFALSFAVIWLLWTAHHRQMEHFAAYDDAVLRLTLLFLFSIVALPFVTQLLTSELYTEGSVPLYDAVLLASSLSLAGLAWWGRRHPELLDDRPEAQEWREQSTSLVTAGIVLVALVLSVVVPAVGSWPLIALVLDDRIEGLWARLRRRRPAQDGSS
jgi:uncharacterized membrane protein